METNSQNEKTKTQNEKVKKAWQDPEIIILDINSGSIPDKSENSIYSTSSVIASGAR
jgi:hypothetical protein